MIQLSVKIRSSTRIFALALLLAAAALIFCTKSSPAYPINEWTDANVYFSVGKGMVGGQVVYRDLYDHKGPLIYALHALCALVSPMSFTGVYVLECLFAAAFLTIAYRLLELYGVRRLLWAGVALVAVAVYTSYSFLEGDSAEELCLPLLLYALYDLLKWARSGGEPLGFGRVALIGALFGCVFWTKFTLCGVFAGYFIVLVVAALRGRAWRAALRYVAAFASGFALATLPWVIYFGLNGAIYDWLKVYLYDNLFLYSGGEGAGLIGRLKDMAKSGLQWLVENPLYTAPVLLGLGWSAALCLGKKNSNNTKPADDAPDTEGEEAARGNRRRECLALWTVAAISALGVFIGGKSYPYYGLALAFLCVPGLGYLLGLSESLLHDVKPPRAPTRVLVNVAVSLCAVAACFGLSPNVRQSFLMPREQTMQYKLAAIIDRYESPTLLNYGFMDAGFYTAAGVTPSVKYFHQTNVPLQEMLSEQTRYIDEGLCDFVVTRGRQPDSIGERYELVGVAESPGYWYTHAYLYKLRELRERDVQTVAPAPPI